MKDASNDDTVLEFPSAWAGSWVDGAGKLLEIRCSGELVFVSFRRPGSADFYSLAGQPGCFSEDLPGRFFRRADGCVLLEVELGGPLLCLEFWVVEESGLRMADARDVGKELRLRPVLVEGFVEGDSLAASWVYPLLFFAQA